MVSAPVLAFPDCSKAFILDTDASNQGIRAVLSQVHNGEERVVAYASRSLAKAERRYSVTRKELLAMVTFLSHFDHICWEGDLNCVRIMAHWCGL